MFPLSFEVVLLIIQDYIETNTDLNKNVFTPNNNLCTSYF